MHNKFEINRTKIRGSCQSGRKVVIHNSRSDLPLKVPPLFSYNKGNFSMFFFVINYLKLLLLLFLQQFQLTKLLLTEIMFVVKLLIFFIAINDFGSGCCHNNPINFEFSCTFSCFLFQIHFGNVILGQRSFPNDGFAGFFRTRILLLRCFFFAAVVIFLLFILLLCCF